MKKQAIGAGVPRARQVLEAVIGQRLDKSHARTLQKILGDRRFTSMDPVRQGRILRGLVRSGRLPQGVDATAIQKAISNRLQGRATDASQAMRKSLDEHVDIVRDMYNSRPRRATRTQAQPQAQPQAQSQSPPAAAAAAEAVPEPSPAPASSGPRKPDLGDYGTPEEFAAKRTVSSHPNESFVGTLRRFLEIRKGPAAAVGTATVAGASIPFLPVSASASNTALPAIPAEPSVQPVPVSPALPPTRKPLPFTSPEIVISPRVLLAVGGGAVAAGALIGGHNFLADRRVRRQQEEDERRRGIKSAVDIPVRVVDSKATHVVADPPPSDNAVIWR
jgi:hypothetical protein